MAVMEDFRMSRLVAARLLILLVMGIFFGVVGSVPAWGQCEFAKLVAEDGGEGDYFGIDVAVDGDVAVVGAMFGNDNDTDTGAAYVFRFDGEAWNQEQKLLADDGAEGDRFGYAVAVSGNVVVVGAYDNDDNGITSGSAYVFRFDESSWVQEDMLLPDDGLEYQYFGWSVAISGDVAVIGAFGDDDNGNDAGAAYVFRFDESSWVQEQKLLADDGWMGDNFGYSVAIDGAAAVIGAYLDCDSGTYSGSAYVFRFDQSSWIQEQKLLADDGAAGDRFGNSVAIAANAVVIGAVQADAPGTDSGSAYVFRYVDSSWGQEQKLLPADGAEGDRFGYSVAVIGDTAVIGAIYDEDETGSAYVFRFVDPEWIEQAKLSASDGAVDDRFGVSAALCGDTAVIGAYRYGEDDSGAAYVFDLAGEDCNDNSRCDSLDIADGTSEDCNENEIPDECDIADGTSEDCTGNGIPDECEPDCNDNGVADSCDIADETSQDCDENEIPDECDIADCVDDAACADCDVNGVPDGCEYDLTDCNENYIADDCEVAQGLCDDCNENGIPDACDVLEGTSEDCNGNEIPDECEVYFFSEASPQLSPLGDGVPQSYTIANPPLTGIEVELTFEAVGDLGALTEWVDVDINGVAVGRVFMNDANDCPAEPDVEILIVPAETYNPAVEGTDAVINMVASSAVDPEWCAESYIAVTIQYQAIGPDDCNGNGVPDICDVLSGTSLDQNENEIPDECEPECPGDLDADYDVDLADLAQLLGHYGMTSGAAYVDGDLDDDGDVDLADLAELLGHYGDVCE